MARASATRRAAPRGDPQLPVRSRCATITGPDSALEPALPFSQTGRRSRARLAWQAALTAFLVTVAFAAFGQQILHYLGISLPALQTAGGLLLLLVALELLTGKQETSGDGASAGGGNVALVPLGTPLLAGPGAIVTAIVYVRRIDTLPDLVTLAVGLVAVHVAVWLALRFSGLIIRVIKDNGIQLVTRISGLLLSAIAVQLIADAIRAFMRAG